MRVAKRVAGLLAMVAALVGGCAVGSDPAGGPLDAAKEESDLELDADDEPAEPEDATPDVPARTRALRRSGGG